MPLSTRFGGLLLATLAAAPAARAQTTTAPAWTGVATPGYLPVSAAALATDAAGNTYAGGTYSAPFTVGGITYPTAGNLDGYLIKYMPDGAVAWVYRFATAANELVGNVALDAAGNPYVVGSFVTGMPLGNGLELTNATTATQTFVVRFSPQGVPQWAAQSTTTTTANGQSIVLDAQGQVYVGGLFSNTVRFGSPARDLTAVGGLGTYLAIFSAATGELRALTSAFNFVNRPTGTTTYPGCRMAAIPGGGVYLFNTYTVTPAIGAATFPSRGGNDVVVAKYDAQGNAEWATQIGGNGNDQVQDGKADAAGSLYLCGSFSEAVTVGTTATTGTTTLPVAGALDGLLAKFSPQGSLLWARATAGTGTEGWGSLTLDAADNLYATGSFTESCAFGGSTTRTSAGSNDIVVAAYTPQGQLRWAQQAGGPGSDIGYHTGFDAQGNAHVFGVSSGTACAFGSFSLTPATTPATFLARLGTAALATGAARPQPLALYPSPATDYVTLPALPAGTCVLLLDALGRPARETTVSAAAQVAVRGLAPGLYTLRATDAQGRPFVGKVVVE